MNYSFSGLYSPQDLTELYEGDGLLAKIVDMPAEDAVGAGFALEGIGSKATEYYQGQLDLLQWERMAETAIKWQRLYGGALMVVLADDGGRIEQPLQLQTVQRVDGLLVFDSAHITPRMDREGKPEMFSVETGRLSFDVHTSRCLTFRSDPLPEQADDPITAFFGSPLYVRINEALSQVYASQGARVRMLNRFSQTVYKISGLAELLSTEQGEQQLSNRMEVFDLSRGLFSSVVIGEGDSLLQVRPTAPLTEAAGLINSAWSMLSAVTGIPLSILTGGHVLDSGAKIRAPLQKTADDDSPQLYASFIKDIQMKQIKNPLQRLLTIIGRAGVAAGALDKLEPVRIKFNPLYPASPVEAADNELKAAQSELARAKAICQYARAGVFTPDEAMKIIRKRSNYD